MSFTWDPVFAHVNAICDHRYSHEKHRVDRVLNPGPPLDVKIYIGHCKADGILEGEQVRCDGKRQGDWRVEKVTPEGMEIASGTFRTGRLNASRCTIVGHALGQVLLGRGVPGCDSWYNAEAPRFPRRRIWRHLAMSRHNASFVQVVVYVYA